MFWLFSCHLHVFFHGCAMSTDSIGTEFLENSGLLEMAEANQIVMLFPQVFTSFTKKACLFLSYDIFRLKITCFWEIHMAAGTSWVISVTFPMVHMLLRMPHRCVEFTKWSIEWLEELSNKVVNKSSKIKKFFFEVSKFQFFFNLNYNFSKSIISLKPPGTS